ncbi:MAG: PAS domain S-box protein [Thermodesulfobacteriota bacterium]|nr:PAS domain S-box protein [Thermodesulfobacteriota bacterium]
MGITERSKTRKFFSLRWKAILYIVFILLVINICFSSISYLNLIKQLDYQKEVDFQRYIKEIQALVEQSFLHLQQIGIMLPKMIHYRLSNNTNDIEILTHVREDLWPNLMLNTGIDNLRFYDSNNQLIIDYGETDGKEKEDSFVSTWIAEVNRQEKPMRLIDCAKGCKQYIAIPLLAKGENSGVVMIGTSLLDIVLDFKQMSDVDMGIIIRSENVGHIQEDDPSRTLDSWRARVICLTGFERLMPILGKIADKNNEIEDLFKGLRINASGRTLDIKLIPIIHFGLDLRGEGYFVLMNDITPSISKINAAFRQTIWIGLIGLFFSVALCLLVIWRPLSRLRRTALYLPLLAESKFQEARDAMHKDYRIMGRKDEVDVLIDTSTTLSCRLERLAQTVTRQIDELSRERDFIKSLLDTAQVIILVQDRFGAISLLNQYACLLTMYDEEELMGRLFTDIFINERDDVDFEKKLTQVLNGELENYSNESKVICKDGSIALITWSHCLLNDKMAESAMILSVGLNITIRKKAEMELIQSEKHLQAIFRAADNVSFVTTELDDKDFRIVDFSEGAERIFGYDKKDAIENPIAILFLRQDEPSIAKTYRLMTEKRSEIALQCNLMRKTGIEVPVLLTIHPLFDAYDNIIQVLWVAVDISEITELYKEKENLEFQLRQSQKMEAIGTLAGGIAHDFNNILQAISGYIQLILKNKSEDDPDFSRLMTIEGSVEKASKLTKQLLIFSRKVKSELKPVDLNYEIRQMVLILERMLPKMVAIVLELSEKPQIINADPVQLEQIMMNLAINARDAISNEGKIVFRTENIVLSEEYCKSNMEVKQGDYVEFVISDTGHGISEEALGHIFEPFYTTKERGKGTGLGLAMVYGIVKNHDGHIICQSELGKGTSFHIYFPELKEVLDDFKEKEVISIEMNGGKETILIVDDEESILDTEEEVLTESGYNVLLARSGEEAINIFKKAKEQIDLVVLDLNMPGIGGKQSIAELEKIDPKIRVLLCTGYSDSISPEDVSDSAIKGLIRKPFRFSDFLTKIRTILDVH